MKDLTEGSVIRHLLHMAAFMAVSMFVQTLYLLADLYWVGRLGKEAIAAVGVAGNLMMVVLALTQTLGVGTTTLIAQSAGRKDQPHAERAFKSVVRYVAHDRRAPRRDLLCDAAFAHAGISDPARLVFVGNVAGAAGLF